MRLHARDETVRGTAHMKSYESRLELIVTFVVRIPNWQLA